MVLKLISRIMGSDGINRTQEVNYLARYLHVLFMEWRSRNIILSCDILMFFNPQVDNQKITKLGSYFTVLEYMTLNISLKDPESKEWKFISSVRNIIYFLANPSITQRGDFKLILITRHSLCCLLCSTLLLRVKF